jgi:hypothetical protein
MEPLSLTQCFLYSIPALIYADQRSVATMRYVEDRIDELEDALLICEDDIVVNEFRTKFNKNFA